VVQSGLGSVSPFFGNEPAFKVYHYVPAVARIDDIYTYTDVIEHDNQGQFAEKPAVQGRNHAATGAQR